MQTPRYGSVQLDDEQLGQISAAIAAHVEELADHGRLARFDTSEGSIFLVGSSGVHENSEPDRWLFGIPVYIIGSAGD